MLQHGLAFLLPLSASVLTTIDTSSVAFPLTVTVALGAFRARASVEVQA
ncbi:MAG TPA: hypothetical protein VGX78_18660 [Pirellulales bacterium]|nr:hypothetical protein [Pirellulales bacterium]